MELRKTEEEVNSIAAAYESLRGRNVLPSRVRQDVRVDLSSLPSLDEMRQLIVPDKNKPGKLDECVSGHSHGPCAGETTLEIDLKQALIELESLRRRLEEIRKKTLRFRQRLIEKDPVTKAPRYGEKTMLRVTTMLNVFDALEMGVGIAFGEKQYPEGENVGDSVVGKMQRIVQEEEDVVERSKIDATAAEANEAVRREEEKRKLEETKREEEAAAMETKRRQEAELHRQALEARRQREERDALEAQAARDADRAFIASVKKGPDGVREQLSVLRDATSSDPNALSVAIGALHTIFSQIAAHPEEIKYRRIRRDHPEFVGDIGRHPGGKEVLVAAGFIIDKLDGIPCFFSKEPDIEHDMDGWSEWFNSLKSTLEIIEEEMIK